jgi:hypothetical protein
MRFLKKAYIQRAIREEAKGKYKQAAALYSKAEEFDKVGEMHELLGDMARAFPAKIREYQQAIRWYKQAEYLEKIAAKLAKTMEVEIRVDAKVSPIELHRLPKVAEYYALAKQWEKAGKIYEELGMFDEALEMYVQGGHVEHVERISVRKEDRDHRTYSAQQYYEEAEAAYRIGQRDKAYQALKQCLTIEKNHVKARHLFEQLERTLRSSDTRIVRIPITGHEYILLGKNIVTIGRQEGNDIVLRRNDVSRTHARIGFRGHRVLVEDLHSSNGTRINGLRIQQQAEIRDRDVLGIGRSFQFEVRIRKRSTGISASLCSAEREGTQRYYLLFCQEIYIGAAHECELPLPHMSSHLPPQLLTIHCQPPFWYFHFHPDLTDVELNGIAVSKYVVVLPGDTLAFGGINLLFE